MSKKAELSERFLELRLQGKTYEVISEELQVSKQSLINWSKDPALQDVLKFGKMMRLQAILDKYQMTREASLEKLCLLANKCLQEISKRDLSELPTDKLVKIFLSMEKQIASVAPKPVLFEDDEPFSTFSIHRFAFDVFE